MKPKKCSKKDVDLLVKIDNDAKDPLDKKLNLTSSWKRKHFKKILEDKLYEAYRIEKKGFTILKKGFQAHNSCEIDWLVVAEKYQKQGIGKKLIQYVENRVKKLKFKSIYLYTSVIHKQAIKFYLKQGYKKINEFPDYYSDGSKSLLFGKKIK